MSIVKHFFWGIYIAITAYIAPLIISSLITMPVDTLVIPLVSWAAIIVLVIATYTRWSRASFDGVIFAMLGSALWYIILINIYGELLSIFRAHGIATDTMEYIAEALTLGGIPVLVVAVPFSAMIASVILVMQSKSSSWHV